MTESHAHTALTTPEDAPRPDSARALTRSERRAELVLTAALIALVVALAAVAPTHGRGSWTTAVLLTLVYAGARRVRFSAGGDYVLPTQVVLVPMLFLVPPAVVPLLVALGLCLGLAPEFVRGRVARDRMLTAFGDAWHAMGAAVVIAVAAPGPPQLAHWPVYLAALLAQCGCDSVVTLIREWISTGARPDVRLGWSALCYAVDAALAPIGLLTAIVAFDHPAAIVLVLPLIALLAALGQERERRIEHTLALSAAYRGSALLVGEMLEADDAYTGGEHTHGVVQLCLAVGEELRLSPSERRDLEFGALLHDVGKLRTPNEIINKPGALTPEEWEIIRRHPVDGQDMLDRIGGVLTHAGLIVRSHHERWDGGGYPDGLRGEEIPRASRIVCACDAFSAMTTDRSYRSALPASEAAAELRRCAGLQFDPRVVDALLAVIERSGALADPEPMTLAA